MYSIFLNDMFAGEVCKLYELSNPNDDLDDTQGDCLKNYANDPSKYIEQC